MRMEENLCASFVVAVAVVRWFCLLKARRSAAKVTQSGLFQLDETFQMYQMVLCGIRNLPKSDL